MNNDVRLLQEFMGYLETKYNSIVVLTCVNVEYSASERNRKGGEAHEEKSCYQRN